MIHWIAQAGNLDTEGYREHLKYLVFMGVFFVGMIVVVIWWLKRNA